MRSPCWKVVLCGVSISGASVLLSPSIEASPAVDDVNKPSVDQVAEAGAMFQKNCVSCHQPPDLKFATDRAWLDQLNRTA